jgi:hypothetical protein
MWNSRALVRIRPIEALLDLAMPLISFHSNGRFDQCPVGPDAASELDERRQLRAAGGLA